MSCSPWHIFDASLARANINPKKIYCIDHALVISTSSGILVNTGHLLENLVFTALRRTTPEIVYFKAKSGREVDFLVQGQDRYDGAFRQLQLSHGLAQRRELALAGLRVHHRLADLDQGTGTRGEEEQIQVESGKINVVPACRMGKPP